MKKTLLRHIFKVFRQTTKYERMSRTLNNAKNFYELLSMDIWYFPLRIIQNQIKYSNDFCSHLELISINKNKIASSFSGQINFGIKIYLDNKIVFASYVFIVTQMILHYSWTKTKA